MFTEKLKYFNGDSECMFFSIRISSTYFIFFLMLMLIGLNWIELDWIRPKI